MKTENLEKYINLEEILKSKEWIDFEGKIPFVLGKDEEGKTVILDLFETQDILIYAENETERNLFLNTLLGSMLDKNTPESQRFVVMDFNNGNLGKFENSAHNFIAPIKDEGEVLDAIKLLGKEIKRRRDILKELNLFNLTQYNAKTKDKMPYIICIVNGLNPFSEILSAQCNKLVEKMLENQNAIPSRRLGKILFNLIDISRSVGVYLLALPKSLEEDELNALLDSSLKSRISFKTKTKKNSKIFLEDDIAKSLNGTGDMIYKDSYGNLRRVQGACFLDE